MLARILLLLAILPAVAFGAGPIACGKEWINLHSKNPDLIGVYVQQSPDNKADIADYRGKHPAMVIYVFKNQKAHQVSYTPSGQVEEGFWWDIPAGHWVLKDMTTNFKESVFCHYSVKR